MSCDNMGFVWSYFNGSSKDALVYTLGRGLQDLAEGLGIQIQVYHQRRRRDLGDQVADHLSKHEMQEVSEIWPDGVEWPGQGSKVLKAWIESPKTM